MASASPKERDVIAAEIADMESIFAEHQFPDAAFDPIMRPYSLVDQLGDKRADVTSTIQVSDFTMPGITAFDEFHAALLRTKEPTQYHESST